MPDPAEAATKAETGHDENIPVSRVAELLERGGYLRQLGEGHIFGTVDEALQDTFVRVYDNLPKFREDARFEPWLFRILAKRMTGSEPNSIAAAVAG